MITQAQAVADLVAIGYDPGVAAEVLQLADARALRTIQSQGVTSVRSRFVAHRLDENQARADLVGIGIDPGQIDLLLKVWAIEQTANVKELTEAQLRKMVTTGVIQPADYVASLVNQGYSTTDANNLAKAWGLV